MATETTMKEHGVAEQSAKERIIASAVRLFCEKGYEATPVRAIVESAGVTKPVLYYYFENKEMLFRSIVSEAMRESLEQLTRVCMAPCHDFRQHLEAIGHVFFQAARERPHFVRFIHAVAFSGLYDGVFDFRGYWRGLLERISWVFEPAQKKGLLREDLPARTMAMHFTEIVISAMREKVYFPELWDDAQAERGVVQIVMEGIGPR